MKLKATDNLGLTDEQAFSIEVKNTNDATPVILIINVDQGDTITLDKLPMIPKQGLIMLASMR